MEYQMCVHIFGAVSSPSVANFVVRAIGQQATSKEVTYTLTNNFYVDDCLKSVTSADEAKLLIDEMCTEFKSNGFHLTKFVGNNRQVVESIPVEDRVPDLRADVIALKSFPTTRTLGVIWNINSDTFDFKVNIQEKPATRRGILSVTSSFYDPLGMVGPVILEAKRILQKCCTPGTGWDDPLPEEQAVAWLAWIGTLDKLNNLQVSRCFRIHDQIPIRRDVFADASQLAYGAVVYLRCEYPDESVSVAFVIGKSRLAPIKPVTIP
jgi:hypothetical protein